MPTTLELFWCQPHWNSHKLWCPDACSVERTLTIVHVRSLLNYSEHCRLEASAREQSRVLALLNRPLVKQPLKYRMARVAAPCLLCIIFFFTSGNAITFEVVFPKVPKERPEMLRLVSWETTVVHRNSRDDRDYMFSYMYLHILSITEESCDSQ
jgi:hypothetical protein